MVRFAIGLLSVGMILAAGNAGCVIVGGSHPEPGPCTLHPGEHSLVTDETDAAGDLTFDDSITEALTAIARRPGLAPAEQAHLVCVTMHRVTFDDSRLRVLTTLIDNPEFSPRAKSAILRSLVAIPFESSRTTLLQAMEGRGDAERLRAEGLEP